MKNITDRTLQKYIQEAKKDSTKKYKHYGIGNNLSFRVNTKNGNAAWLFRISLPDESKKNGYKFTYMSIGSYPATTLLQARNKRDELQISVDKGINPLEAEKIENKNKITLKEIWDKWCLDAPIKQNTREKLAGMYNNHISKLGNQPISSIQAAVAFNTIIQPILKAGNNRQAKIVLDKLKQLSKFAYMNYLIENNPFDRMQLRKEYLVRKPRSRTLSFDELKLFLPALDLALAENKIDQINHHFIKLVLLLGTRKTELATLKWENYNQEKSTLLLTNTKTNDDLLIKLASQAIILFENLYKQKINDYIFYNNTGNSHMSTRSILHYLKKVKNLMGNKTEHFTVHDLRRTFSSRLSALKFRLELIEKATNHRIQGTAKYYQHDDMLEERYEMLQYWANHLDKLLI